MATLDFAVAKTNQIVFHQQVSNDKKGIAEFLKQLRQQAKTGYQPDQHQQDCIEGLEVVNWIREPGQLIPEPNAFRNEAKQNIGGKNHHFIQIAKQPVGC